MSKPFLSAKLLGPRIDGRILGLFPATWGILMLISGVPCQGPVGQVFHLEFCFFWSPPLLSPQSRHPCVLSKTHHLGLWQGGEARMNR